MHAEIVPLAITMMAGPQIMSALILVTSGRPIPNSLSFVGGVAFATMAGIFVLSIVGGTLSHVVNLGGASGPSGLSKLLQLLLVGLLVWLSIKSYLKREFSKQPKWMSSLVNATPRRAFKLGAALVLFMPTDIIAMTTVGINLASNNLALLDAWPFWLLTVFIAALPLLGYLLFYRRAQMLMPKVRDWMSQKSWLVNILVYALFIYLVLFG